MIQISAGDFKAKCLKLMDFAEKKHETIVITKRGAPIAKLIPYEDKPPRVYGFLKNSVQIVGDVVEPIEEDWDAEKT